MNSFLAIIAVLIATCLALLTRLKSQSSKAQAELTKEKDNEQTREIEFKIEADEKKVNQDELERQKADALLKKVSPSLPPD